MSIKEKLRSSLKGLAYLTLSAVSGYLIMKSQYDYFQEKNLLKNSANYVVESNVPGVPYYYYDTDKDGKIDKIIEFGVAASPRGAFILIKQVHLKEDRDYKSYLNEIALQHKDLL